MTRRRASVLFFLLAASACKDGEQKGEPKEPSAEEAPASGEDAAPEPAPSGPPEAAFEEPVINVGAKEGSAELTLIVRRSEDGRPPRGGKVPFTDEPYTLSVDPKATAKRVREADIFGTGLALDLDGDGDSEDELELACEDGVATVGGTRLEPVMETTDRISLFRYRRDAGGSVARLGEEGAHVLLYGPCDREPVTVGVGPAGEPVSFQESASPALQVLVFERADGPGAESSVRFQKISREDSGLEVPSHGGSLYETLPLEPEPRWYTSRWVMVPLEIDPYQQRVEIELTFEGEEERLAVVSINEAGPGADRVRTRVGGVVLEPLNP